MSKPAVGGISQVFHVQSQGGLPPRVGSGFLLVPDNWDDFGFKTLFVLYYYDKNRNRCEIGAVKIGQEDLGTSNWKTSLPKTFSDLPEGYFSIGQDPAYYEHLITLDNDLREWVLSGLKDFAFNQNIFSNVKDLKVVRVSLLRNISIGTVIGQFQRLSTGGIPLTEFDFSFTNPSIDASHSPVEITFEVIPDSFPPSNIHVLVGRNGVGKTHLLQSMVTGFQTPDAAHREGWGFNIGDFRSSQNWFAGLVSVSFSAFDARPEIPDQIASPKERRVLSVGLKRGDTLKTSNELTEEFQSSFLDCMLGGKRERWKKVIQVLESDPGFADFQMHELVNYAWEGMSSKSDLYLCNMFNNLSSGHKAVLLSLTKLVETVEEKTLVLIDEPESHLHPPLLSGFIRAISILMIERNAVSIIATHSPVVLQEVPKNCVWKLQRTGSLQRAERPSIQTFGENVSVLTREVFDLEVTNSGFHTLLRERAASHQFHDRQSWQNNRDLGSEANAIYRTLIALKSKEDGENS